MNSCFDVDDMFAHVNWMINCWWYWIHVSKIIYVNILCFCEKVMNDEVVFCWTWNELMNNCVDDVWKHVIDELVWRLCLLVIWWWNLLLLWNNYESLVNFWIWTKWCLIYEFLSILMYVFMYMTYKLYLGRVLSVEGSKLDCLGKKGFEIRSFFSGLKSVRLSEA